MMVLWINMKITLPETTSESPALAAGGVAGSLYIAWRGQDSDNKIISQDCVYPSQIKTLYMTRHQKQ
jgi:hypothetical protein